MHVLLSVIVLLFVFAPAHAREPEPKRDAASLHGYDRPGNYCIGGMQDRKVIPHDETVRSQNRETTRLGCEVDGGRARFMPDLTPVVPDGTLV